MSFPSKDERNKCWSSRDEYWKCLDEKAPNYLSTSGKEEPDACIALRKMFEKSCPGQWVKHFDRKRTYEAFKARMEKGFDPMEEPIKDNKGSAT